MELLDLISVKHEISPFPDYSITESEDQPQDPKNIEHQCKDPSRKMWLEREYLRGYLTLFKMQYDETLRILHFLENDYTKQKKSNSVLTKEVKRLNDVLDKMIQANEQLTIGFKFLGKNVESMMKRQEPILQQIEGHSNNRMNFVSINGNNDKGYKNDAMFDDSFRRTV